MILVVEHRGVVGVPQVRTHTETGAEQLAGRIAA
jgi:hypothetical protein